MRLGAICLVFFLLLHCALALTSQLQTIKGEASYGEALEYKLTFFNEEEKEISVELAIFTTWQVSIEPSKLRLKGGEGGEAIVRLYPPKGAKEATYSFALLVSYDGKSEKVMLKGKVVRAPYMSLKVISLPQQVDPRKMLSIEIEVENFYIEGNAKFFFLLMKGEEIIEEYKFVQFLALGKNELTFPIRLDPFLAPGEYAIRAKVELDREVVEGEAAMQVIGYAMPIVSTREEVGWWGRRVTIALFNNGTAPIESYELIGELSPLENLLLWRMTEGARIIEGKVRMEVKQIMPRERAELVYESTYLPLYIIPLAIMLSPIAYWQLTKKVEVRKRIMDYKLAPLAIKVGLFIKNLSKRDFKKVRIEDRVPAFASKVGEFGSLEARKVGKKLVWEISELKAGEELVLSYCITSEVKMVGSALLSPAVVKFEDEKGKKREFKSNEVVIHFAELES